MDDCCLKSYLIENGYFDRQPFRYFTDSEVEFWESLKAQWQNSFWPMTNEQARRLFFPRPKNQNNGRLDRKDTLARVDLEQLVLSDVQGKRRKVGNRLYVCCPWHDDHNPSLMVNLEKGKWKCWACNINGTAIDWVMRRDNVKFLEALAILNESG